MVEKRIFPVLKYTMLGLWWVTLLLGVVCTASFLLAHFRGEIPHIGDYCVMHIVSESMEPTIEKDSYVLIKRVDPSEIAKGDVICFYSTDPNIYGYPNTHRVVEEPILQDGEWRFVTQGDKNVLADSVHAEGERLIGVHVTNLDVMTAVLRFVTQHFLWVLASLCVLGVALVCGSALLSSKKQNAKAEVNGQEKKK